MCHKLCIVTNFKRMKVKLSVLALFLAFVACNQEQSYKFAVICDTRSDGNHNGDSGVNIAAVNAVCNHLVKSGAEFVIAPGDFICGNVTWYDTITHIPPSNHHQYQSFLKAIRSESIGLPGEDSLVTLYPVRGNHECYQQIHDEKIIEEAWLKNMGYSLVDLNGPADEKGFTYSFVRNGSLFIGLDQYMHSDSTKKDSIYINQKWLDKVLKEYPNTNHVFAFGHTPAFAAQHQDCLGEDSLARNTFLQSINNRSGVYFCGHDHFYARANVPVYKREGGIENYIQQVITPSGAPFLGGFSPKWNDKYKNQDVKNEKYIDNAVGYQLVTVEGNKVSVEFIATLDASTHTIDTSGIYHYTYNDNWDKWNFVSMDTFSYELP